MRTISSCAVRFCLTVLAAALTGCALSPHYERPKAPVPDTWPTLTATALTASLDWRDFVADHQLRTLVTSALENNRDLRQTLLNIEVVRAQYRIQRADRLPGIGVQGSGTRQRTPADVSATGASTVTQNVQVGVGLAAFELDLFGRVSSLTEAARQEYLATAEAGNSARLVLVTEVIQAYLNHDGAQQRLHVTHQTLKAREASLALISQRHQHGAASALDQSEAQALQEEARASLERNRREVGQAANALRLLVGDDRQVAALPSSPVNGQLLVQDIVPGLPSDLLVRRPDIVAAEHQLLARNADIGAARAAFFPRITLTGFVGSSSTELSRLFDGDQSAWSFAPQLVLPIFDGGRNRANLDLSNVRKDIAVARYEGVVQAAFRDVADALVATETLQREEASRQSLVLTSGEGLRLSEARYRGGVDNHLRYLEAQRANYANQLALIEVATQRQVALANLFKALGGAWARPS